MNDKKRKPNIWKYLLGTRKFWYGFLIMVLAVLLSFASIYRTIDTYTQEVTWENGDQDNYIGLFSAQEVKENNMHLSYRGSETINIIIYDGMDPDNELLNETLPPGGEYSGEISSDAHTLIVRDYSTGVFEMRYTVRYYTHPYSSLSIPALLMVFIGLYFINKGYQDALDTMVEDLEFGPQEDELDSYTPPTDRKG